MQNDIFNNDIFNKEVLIYNIKSFEHNPQLFANLTAEVQENVLKIIIGKPWMLSAYHIATFYKYSKINDSFFIKELDKRMKYKHNFTLFHNELTNKNIIYYIDKIALNHIAYHIVNLHEAYIFLNNFKYYMRGWDWILYVEEIKQYIADDEENKQYIPYILNVLEKHIDKKTYQQLEFISTLL